MKGPVRRGVSCRQVIMVRRRVNFVDSGSGVNQYDLLEEGGVVDAGDAGELVVQARQGGDDPAGKEHVGGGRHLGAELLQERLEEGGAAFGVPGRLIDLLDKLGDLGAV